MPCDNPTSGGRFVALDLPPAQVSFLRDEMIGWLDSLRSDLRTPDRLEDPQRCQREAEAVERLMVGLTTRQLFVPDEDAEALFRSAAESHDKENGYAEVVAAHDALHGLLAVLEGGES
jgi:hypothetical protein